MSTGGELWAGGLARAPRVLAPSWRGLLGNLAAVSLVAAGVPWLIGWSFLDPLVLLPFGCLAIFFTAIFIAHEFAGDEAQREFRRLQTTGVAARRILAAKWGAAVVAGWLAGLLMLAASLGALNWIGGYQQWLLPPADMLGAVAGLSLGCSAILGAVGVHVGLTVHSLESAKRILRRGLFVALLAIVFVPRYLPGSWTDWLLGDLTNESIIRKSWITAAVLLGLSLVVLRRALPRLEMWGTSSPPSEAGRRGLL